MPEPLTLLSDDERLFMQEIEKLAQQRLAPAVAEMDEKEEFRPDLLRSFFELGLMGIEIPTQFGGAGGTFFMALLAIETLSRTDAAAGVIVDVQNTLVNNVFHRWGTSEQQQTFYPRLATEAIGCYCLTEPASGSDAFALQCKADAGRQRITFSMARKSSSPMLAKLRSLLSLPTSISAAATVALLPSSSRRARQVLLSAKKKPSLAFVHLRLTR